ncbi:hypothetical protein CONLIGDRAFT_680746 [Coniochaeta ligniaria NRRL 30616]|uniref:GDP/GTP exchange factor Sec2 N-terminal domain-containing protein n=1 Tax=Coniochaeta ligniaria NRRL 30616 TaxID=1408157 RepID=A0A1J7JQC6_9PEZI|nr:hypothetical protein CONLIGDRAFT_680746 [Coniochaeta ligniaria NRRL 30616]
MVMTALAPQTTLSSEPPASCCPNCGINLPLSTPEEAHPALLQAQRQIDDLEAQVRLLNEKASAAVDRWADYEDELARLRLTLENNNNNNHQQEQQRNSTSTTASSAPTTASPARSSFLPAGAVANRISALLSPRKPLPAAPQGPGAPRTDATAEELLTALAREQYLRKEAEGRLSETSREVEDLSVSLFEQANEMVATERKARARLEERVEVLERRDWEKRSRLEKLEATMGRIERARSVLGEPVPGREVGGGEGETDEEEKTGRREGLV